jgi:hypothetical protein
MEVTNPPPTNPPPKRFALSLGDGMKTLLFSAIAYLYAFAYESGYCDWFAISHYLIRLDVTRFLVFSAAIVTFLVFILGLTALL